MSAQTVLASQIYGKKCQNELDTRLHIYVYMFV